MLISSKLNGEHKGGWTQREIKESQVGGGSQWDEKQINKQKNKLRYWIYLRQWVDQKVTRWDGIITK